MRIILLLLFTFFIAQPFISNAQSVKEMQVEMQKEIKDLKDQIADLEKQIITAKKEKSDGVEDLLKELTQLKQQLSMMEQSMKNLAKMPNTLTQQVEKENNDDGDNEIPKRDNARIKQIPDKILSDAELVIFVKKVQSEVEKNIPPADKTKVVELYNLIKTKYGSPVLLGHIASTCWMNGHPETAIFIMGKACTADMTRSGNLNNYASFLTMAGGEHAALPILENLNAKYPGNSTILNNMGQAWFGLGEINKAKKYLNMAIAVHRTHSQANQTMCMIHKAEGNNAEAIKSMKNAIAENYSGEKEAVVTELGGKLENDDLPWKYPKPAGEPLALDKFLAIIPEYPMNVGDAVQKNEEWKNFKEQISNAMDKLHNEIEQLKTNVETYEKKLDVISNQYSLLKPYDNQVYKAADRKLRFFNEWYEEKFIRIYEKRERMSETAEQLNENYKKALVIAQVRGAEQTDNEYCAAINAVSSAFLTTANPLWRDVQLEWVKFEKQAIQEKVGYLMYWSLDNSYFELTKAQIKYDFLIVLSNLKYEYASPCIIPEIQEGRRGTLPDFDEVNCKYKTTTWIPPFTTITIECNKMTTVFDITPDMGTAVGVGIKIGIEENLNTGKYTKGTLEIAADAGFDDVTLGPLKAEAKVTGAVGIEVTPDGVKEVYVKAGVIGELGTAVGDNVPERSLSTVTGVEVSTAWTAGSNGNSGSIKSSATGQGLLKNVNISGPIF